MAHNISETEVELPTHAILTPPPSNQISDTRERPFSWFLLATSGISDSTAWHVTSVKRKWNYRHTPPSNQISDTRERPFSGFYLQLPALPAVLTW